MPVVFFTSLRLIFVIHPPHLGGFIKWKGAMEQSSPYQAPALAMQEVAKLSMGLEPRNRSTGGGKATNWFQVSS